MMDEKPKANTPKQSYEPPSVSRVVVDPVQEMLAACDGSFNTKSACSIPGS
ncbi:MAG TPA: hypothetical protein VJU87_07130 [Gemmatimonadaceae bacterium]|nr:hypothetical protein [Gemmatimonadaceae bacterium]